MEPGVGFDHQVDHLIASGYPGSCEMTPLAFRQRLAPLRATIEDLPPAAWESRIPFVIVVRSTLLPADRAMPLVRLGDRTGFTRMSFLETNTGLSSDEILRRASSAEAFAPFRQRFLYNNVHYLAAGSAAGTGGRSGA